MQSAPLLGIPKHQVFWIKIFSDLLISIWISLDHLWQNTLQFHESIEILVKWFKHNHVKREHLSKADKIFAARLSDLGAIWTSAKISHFQTYFPIEVAYALELNSNQVRSDFLQNKCFLALRLFSKMSTLTSTNRLTPSTFHPCA